MILVATVIGNSFALLAEVLIVRSLEPATYGELSLAYAIVFSAGNLVLFGVNEGVTRQFSASDDPDHRGRIAVAGYVLLIASGTVAAIAFYLFRGEIARLMNSESITPLLALFVPYLIVFPLSKVSFSILRGRKQSLPAAIAQHIGGRGLALAGLAVFVLLGEGFSGAFAYWLGYPLFLLLFALLFLRRDVSYRTVVNTLPDRKTFLDLWSFSWPLALGSVVFLLLERLDVLMIGYFLDSSNVAYYRSVLPLKQVAMFALGAFTFLFLPLATEYYENDDRSGLNEIFTVSTKWVILVTLPPVLVFGFFSESVVSVFFGEEYRPAASVLTILVVGLLFRALSGLDGDMVKAIDRPRIELYSAVGGLVANFALNASLIPRLGIDGAAIATVIGYAVYNGVELVWIHRLTGATPISPNVAKHVGGMFLITAAVAALLPSGIGLATLIGVGGLLVIVEPIILVVTRSVDEADLDLIYRLEGRLDVDLGRIESVLRRGT